MCRPKAAVSNVRGKKTIVQRIKRAARSGGAYSQRKSSRADRDRNIRRDARRSARITNSSHDQSAKRGVARTDDVTLSRIWIVIVHSARAVWPVAGDQSAKCRHHDWAAI